MGAEKSLYDYLQILKSPEVFPDIAGAGFLFSPIISVASNLIAYAGIIAMVFVILRIGVDVMIVAGVGNILRGSGKGNRGKAADFLTQLSSFRDDDKEVPYNDPWKYITEHGYKIIVMLAFIGLMISGQLLPLAGTFTASAGAVISKVAKINPVPYIEALEIDVAGLDSKISRGSVSSLIKEYNKHTGNMTSALQRSQKRDELDNEEYAQVAAAYYNSYWAAEVYGCEMEKTYNELKAEAEESGEVISKDGERLRSFNFNSHRVNVDPMLLKHGKEFNPKDGRLSGNIYAETDLEKKAKEMMADVKTMRRK